MKMMKTEMIEMWIRFQLILTFCVYVINKIIQMSHNGLYQIRVRKIIYFIISGHCVHFICELCAYFVASKTIFYDCCCRRNLWEEFNGLFNLKGGSSSIWRFCIVCDIMSKLVEFDKVSGRLLIWFDMIPV